MRGGARHRVPSRVPLTRACVICTRIIPNSISLSSSPPSPPHARALGRARAAAPILRGQRHRLRVGARLGRRRWWRRRRRWHAPAIWGGGRRRRGRQTHNGAPRAPLQGGAGGARTWRRARRRRVRRHDRGDFAAGRVRARKRTTPPTDRSLLPVPRPNARATAHSHCKTAIWVLFGTTTPPGNLFSCLEITGTPHNTPRIAIVRRRNDFNAKSASFKNHSF